MAGASGKSPKDELAPVPVAEPVVAPATDQRVPTTVVPETPGVKPAKPETVAERRARAEEEWGQWVAAGEIRSDSGALAYNAGDKVPAANVVEHGYDTDGLVVRPDGWEG